MLSAASRRGGLLVCPPPVSSLGIPGSSRAARCTLLSCSWLLFPFLLRRVGSLRADSSLLHSPPHPATLSWLNFPAPGSTLLFSFEVCIFTPSGGLGLHRVFLHVHATPRCTLLSCAWPWLIFPVGLAFPSLRWAEQAGSRGLRASLSRSSGFLNRVLGRARTGTNPTAKLL